MAVQDYYSLLSLSRIEPSAGIAAARRDYYRNIEHGYNACWSQARASAFERAFSVLCSEGSRRAYDETLRSSGGAIAGEPRAESRPESRAPRSVLASPEFVHPSAEGLRQRLLRNFTGRDIPKAEHAEALSVEIPATTEDIEQRRSILVGVPTFDLCSACNGTGRTDLFECADCAGQGLVERIALVERLPGREQMIECSLDDLGIRNFFLRLQIRVMHA